MSLFLNTSLTYTGVPELTHQPLSTISALPLNIHFTRYIFEIQNNFIFVNQRRIMNYPIVQINCSVNYLHGNKIYINEQISLIFIWSNVQSMDK
jgi:hypothetical protein